MGPAMVAQSLVRYPVRTSTDPVERCSGGPDQLRRMRVSVEKLSPPSGASHAGGKIKEGHVSAAAAVV